MTLSAPPKVEARGKFSSEVLTKLAELRRNPIIDDGDSLELVKDTPPVKSAPVPAPKAEKAALPPAKAEDTPAPAPSSDAAAVIAERDALKARMAEIEKREAALLEREESHRKQYGDVGAKLAADPFGALRELAKANLGTGASEAEIEAELTDLITEASIKLAGANVDAKDERAALRALQREMRLTKAENRRREATISAEREAAAKAAERAREEQAVREDEARANAIISREWSSIKNDFPWLAEEDDAVDLIWSHLSRHHKITGVAIPIAEAAKKLDDELASIYRSKFEKRSRLLQPTAQTQASAAANGHQGDQPRRSRPLTNADASEDTAPPAPKAFQSVTEMRKEAMKRVRPMLAQLREAAGREAD